MLNPFINLVGNLISLINLVLIVWIVMSLLLQFDIINRQNPVIQRIFATLQMLVEPMLRPIRRILAKFLPNLGGIDLSPIALILLLHFLSDALYSWFYTL
ncbi:MAG: YggT family protein [Alphaproteobacteria bacterium]